MNLLQELLIEETPSKYLPLTEALEEAVKELNLTRGGGVVKGVNAFFRTNPGLTIAAGAMAVSAYTAYQKAKRNTINLHAKDPYEKKMMTDIVDALTQQGRFKIHRIKFENGGKTWVLRRIGH